MEVDAGAAAVVAVVVAVPGIADIAAVLVEEVATCPRNLHAPKVL